MNIKTLIGETTEYDKKAMLEVKKSKSWLKSVSAFANGIGGCLLFGIDNENNVVGIANAQRDAEIISEQIKAKISPIPEIVLKIQKLKRGNVITVKVLTGDEPPYFYMADGIQTAFMRVGNESVPASATDLKRLALRGRNSSFDSLVTEFHFKDYAFSKLRAAYYGQTGKSMEKNDFESFDIVNRKGFLTNAGALFADEGAIRQSRVFCTRWNGLDKASGVIDALDDAEYSGSLILLLEESVNFVKRNSKTMWKKEASSRTNYPSMQNEVFLKVS